MSYAIPIDRYWADGLAAGGYRFPSTHKSPNMFPGEPGKG